MSEPDAVPLPREGEVFFDVRGDARTMRLSWYADSAVAVFSVWQGNRCTGTFRLPFGDLARMTEALQSGPSSRSANAPGPVGDAAFGGRADPALGYPQTASYPAAAPYPGPAYPAAGPGGFPAQQPRPSQPGQVPAGHPAHYPGPPGYPDPGHHDPGYHDPGYHDPAYHDPAYHQPDRRDGAAYDQVSRRSDRPRYDYAAYDSGGYQDPPGYGRGDYQERSGREASRYPADAADYAGLHSGHPDHRYDGSAPFGPRQSAPAYAPPDSSFGPGDPAFGPGDPGLRPGDPGYGPGDPGYGPGTAYAGPDRDFASSGASGEWLTAPTGTNSTRRPAGSAEDGQASPQSEQAGTGQPNTDWEAATASYRAL